jgi:hypothetical protein
VRFSRFSEFRLDLCPLTFVAHWIGRSSAKRAIIYFMVRTQKVSQLKVCGNAGGGYELPAVPWLPLNYYVQETANTNEASKDVACLFISMASRMSHPQVAEFAVC